MKTKTTAFLTDGRGTLKRVNIKPKNWAFKFKSEGREGKSKRKTVKLKERGWSLVDLNAHFAFIQAGLPECTWTITCNNPQRRLTAVDFIRIRCAAFNKPNDLIVVKYNDAHKVLELDDVSDILPKVNPEPKLGDGTLG